MKTALPERLERVLLVMLAASFAVAQPMFSLLGRQPEFLVAHQLSSNEIIALALVLAWVLPLAVAMVIESLAVISKRLVLMAFLLAFSLLSSAAVLHALVAYQWSGPVALVLAVLLGAGFTVAVMGWSVARLFARFLMLGIVLFPLMFLMFSRAGALVSNPANATLTKQPKVTLEHTPDIIFLVLDEFPVVSLLNGEAQLDRQRYPNFARLADQSNWYAAATTGAEVTVHAVPQALTGLDPQPQKGLLPITSHHPRNLFTLLQSQYQIRAMETATNLCPRSACGASVKHDDALTQGKLGADLQLVLAHLLVPEPWSARLPSISDAWSGFGQAEAVIDARAENPGETGLEDALSRAALARQTDWRSRSQHVHHFIEGFQQATAQEQGGKRRPQLHYLHSLLPHRVWRFLPDGRQYLIDEVWAALDPPDPRPVAIDTGIFGHRWQADGWAVDNARWRHLQQVGHVDHLLGELLDRLESQGRLQDALLVVIGDHGAAFQPGQPRRTVSVDQFVDIAGIPLFIKLPGQTEGQVNHKPATLSDVLPTLFDALGATPDWPMDGRSLLKPAGRKSTDQREMRNAAGQLFSLSNSDYQNQMSRRARDFAQTFQSEHPDRPLTYGDHRNLMGQAVSAFNQAPASGATVQLTDPDMVQHVLANSGFIPLHGGGQLSGLESGAGPYTLAIAVDGSIQAITRSYTIAGFEDRFEFQLPASSLPPGQHRLDVYLVWGTGDSVSLSPLPQPSQHQAWVLERQAGQDVLSLDRTRIPVTAGPPPGHVISLATETAGLVQLAGGISDKADAYTNTDTDARTSIVVFVDGRFARHTVPADGMFEAHLSLGPDQKPASSRVQVFAVAADRTKAVELNYPGICDPDWLFAAPTAWQGVSCAAPTQSPLVDVNGGHAATLDFGDPTIRPWLRNGWDMEISGVSWIVGQSAELEIPLPQGLAKLTLMARIKPFVHPPDLISQTLWLLANGEAVQSWELSAEEFTDIHATISPQILALSPERLVLTWLTPDARSPASVGQGADLRILGIAMHQLHIAAKTAPPNPSTSQ